VNPSATAIVAAYDEERHIEACLASLGRQTYAPLEIIVADDGSRDRTAGLAERHAGVRVLRLPHHGKARALNKAAAEARGSILLFLDADLRFAPDYVEHLLAPIVAGAAIGTSHASETVANPESTWARCMQVSYGLPADQRLNLTDAQIAEGSTVYRAILKERFLAVGGFEDTGYTDDQSLTPKLGQRAAFVRQARCEHYNPDRLSEVFRMGVWGGKSVHHLHGKRAALSRFPLVVFLESLGAASRHGMPALTVYQTVFGTGVWWGVCKRALDLDRGLGA